MVLSVAAAALALGPCLIALVDWQRAPSWLLHLCTVAGLVVIAIVVGASGGAGSPAWNYLFFVGLYSAYFYRRQVAVVYIAGCILAHALAILYDARALHDTFLAQLLVAAGG